MVAVEQHIVGIFVRMLYVMVLEFPCDLHLSDITLHASILILKKSIGLSMVMA